MKIWFFTALIFFITIIFFVARHIILENKKKKDEENEESKQLVFHFIRNQFPESVNLLDVAAYSRTSLQESQEILCVLINEKRVSRQKYRYSRILRELNEYKYCPQFS